MDVAGGHAGACRDCKNIGRILVASGEVDGIGQMGEVGGIGQMGEVGGTKEGWATLLWLGANVEEVSMATTVQLKRRRKMFQRSYLPCFCYRVITQG